MRTFGSTIPSLIKVEVQSISNANGFLQRGQFHSTQGGHENGRCLVDIVAVQIRIALLCVAFDTRDTEQRVLVIGCDAGKATGCRPVVLIQGLNPQLDDHSMNQSSAAVTDVQLAEVDKNGSVTTSLGRDLIRQ